MNSRHIHSLNLKSGQLRSRLYDAMLNVAILFVQWAKRLLRYTNYKSQVPDDHPKSEDLGPLGPKDGIFNTLRVCPDGVG